MPEGVGWHGTGIVLKLMAPNELVCQDCIIDFDIAQVREQLVALV